MVKIAMLSWRLIVTLSSNQSVTRGIIAKVSSPSASVPMNHARAEIICTKSSARLTTAVRDRRWWESGWLWLVLAIASTIPFWWQSVPPLVDLPGHLGRYRVQLELGSSESLQRYFSFHWALIGNLGIDLLIIPLAPIFGLEGAVKLIVLTIPVLTVGGIYWVAREIHGEPPPTAIFALPFIYSFPFNFGFTNFSLSMGLALIALGGWLHLSAREKWRLRAAVFVPASCILWLVHAFGWAFLLLTAWSAELVRRHDSGSSFIKSAFREVADALVGYRRAREFRETQEQLVTSAQDARRLADLRYQGGATSYLEVLDSDTRLFSAELDLAEAQQAELATFVEIYRALGGGWRE